MLQGLDKTLAAIAFNKFASNRPKTFHLAHKIKFQATVDSKEMLKFPSVIHALECKKL